ncbi:YybH family protein [Hymenobacter crusticola]|uniref:DUF4440 domain-containing protein n=1 Tax=Hymenobacter crusticola TaxID=1770526 RepID=A0A243W8D1_9BACT|nr:nuclear transport factor 2 family protein [Hymenobacter crusticola]OUJ71424.1 hypothetical protein BXP70_21960 [Hymenobacter crusticola]
MNKLFATLLLATTCYLGAPWWRIGLGAGPTPSDYQTLVSAERAFSAFTSAHGIKAGFTRFLADEALVIVKGRYQLGKPLFEQMPVQPGVLSWQPHYARLAASGDFGYTTGPFEVRPHTATDVPVGFGHFTSVWRKTSTGEWKVVADVGITHPAPGQPSEASLLTPPAVRKAAPADTAARRQELLAAEENLGRLAAAQSLQAAYKAVLPASPTVRLYRSGSLPYVGAAATTFAAAQTQPATFSDAKAVVAASGDLGFTYGYAQLQDKKGPFLRIWQRGAKNAWQLVHEVLDVH